MLQQQQKFHQIARFIVSRRKFIGCLGFSQNEWIKSWADENAMDEIVTHAF